MVIIKAVNRWLKEAILECQDDLPSYISVCEHLTKYTNELMSSAKSIVGQQNVEIFNTSVFAKLNGKKRKIRNSKDIMRLRNDAAKNNSMQNTRNINSASPSSRRNISPRRNDSRTRFAQMRPPLAFQPPQQPTVYSSAGRIGRPRGRATHHGRGHRGHGMGSRGPARGRGGHFRPHDGHDPQR